MNGSELQCSCDCDPCRRNKLRFKLAERCRDRRENPICLPTPFMKPPRTRKADSHSRYLTMDREKLEQARGLSFDASNGFFSKNTAEIRQDSPRRTSAPQSAANKLSKGWNLITRKLDSGRLASCSDRISNLNVPGKQDDKPSSRLLHASFDVISQSLPDLVKKAKGLLTATCIDSNPQHYRPSNPIWKPYSIKTQGSWSSGLKVPTKWEFDVNHSKLSSLEHITANILHVSAFIELISVCQSLISHPLSAEGKEELICCTDALQVASKDLLILDAALASNLTLLRRDAVLECSVLPAEEASKLRLNKIVGDNLFPC